MEIVKLELLADGGRNIPIDPRSSQRFVIYTAPNNSLAYDFAPPDKDVSTYRTCIDEQYNPEPDGKKELTSQSRGAYEKSLMINPKGTKVHVDIDSRGDRFYADIRYIYKDGSTESHTIRGEQSHVIPQDASKVEGLEEFEIDIGGVSLSNCVIRGVFETKDMAEEEQETQSDAYLPGDDDAWKKIAGEEIDEEDDEEDEPVALEEPEDIARRIAESNTYGSAISSLERGRASNKLVDEVIEVLNKPREMPGLINSLGEEQGDRLLKASLVSHKVRELAENSESPDELVWAIEVTGLEADMPVYDEPEPNQDLGHFTAEVVDSAKKGIAMEVPTYCGLQEALNSMVKLQQDDPSDQEVESQDDSDFIFGQAEPEMTEEDPFGFDSEPTATADAEPQTATTPGAEDGLTFGNDQTNHDYEKYQNQTLRSIADSEGMTSAIGKLEEMTTHAKPDTMDKFYLTDMYEDEEREKYTVEHIIEKLKQESGAANGRVLSELKHLNHLDNRFLPVLRSLVVSETIRRSSYPHEARLNLESIKINQSDKVFAGQSKDFGPNSVTLREMTSTVKEIESMVKGSNDDSTYYSDIRSAVRSLPVDAGIRRNVRKLQAGRGSKTIENKM